MWISARTLGEFISTMCVLAVGGFFFAKLVDFVAWILIFAKVAGFVAWICTHARFV